MKEWILILTLIGDSSQSGQSIEHIPGFITQQECLAAGNDWLRSMTAARENRTPRANCVVQTKRVVTDGKVEK